ncbi:MAG: NADPH-dependent FMN reductase [Rhodobacteraceae bacterium]|nr:NADPH-dependent FMN reductase [Paracoccaceae bacterium]
MSLKLKIITGSTRPGRMGPIVANWVAEAAAKHAGFDAELVDIADLNLPLLDEPNHPAAQQYEHEHTKKWSAIIDDADAFIFVTPEYDSFPSAALVNALQLLVKEWAYKPAGTVSYGGISGGLRSAQELRQLIGNLNMVALNGVVPVPFHWEKIEDGKLVANEPMEQGLAGMLDELVKWGETLKPMHSADVAAAA